MILPPPSPFLDAKDLNSRYASEVRKLSNVTPVQDGDAAFYKVDTRRPAHELETGVCADALNKRFEDGRAWPRFGIDTQAWGKVTDGGTVWGYARFNDPQGFDVTLVATDAWRTTDGGRGNLWRILPGNAPVLVPLNGHDIWGTVRLIPSYNGVTMLRQGNERHYFSAKVTLAITSTAITGGTVTVNPATLSVGRAVTVTGITGATATYYVGAITGTTICLYDTKAHAVAGGATGRFAISVNGQAGTLNLLAVDPAASTIQLNDTPTWNNGDEVIFNGIAGGNFSQATLAVTSTAITGATVSVVTTLLTAGRPVTVTGITGAAGTYYIGAITSTTVCLYDTAAHAIAGGSTGKFAITVNGQSGTLSYGITPPNSGAGYYVKTLPGNVIQLYSDAALTTYMTFASAVGQFYLERDAAFPGFYGNGAPPLLARPNASGNTWLDLGMLLVPTSILITSTSSSSSSNPNVVTAPQHGLLPADAVTVTGIHTTNAALITGTVYAYPISPDAVVLYTTSLAALAGGAAGQVPLTVSGESGTLTKAGSTGLPMPSGREGLYFQNRLLVVNGSDTLMISDPLNPLSFSPFVNAVTANLGSSDPITALWPFGSDSVLIMRGTRVDILNNLSGGASAWTLSNVTTEYGCIAPLSVAQTGQDVWFLTRKGVASITQTVNGEVQGVADPVSKPMKKYIDEINWLYASTAVGAYWNNRYFVALPLKGQTGAVQNNGILSYNFLNQGWEGLWSGATLLVAGFARQLIFGEERLTFLDYTGQARWFGDGFTDGAVPISDMLLTRAYTAGSPTRRIWLSTAIIWDTNNPSLTVNALTPGWDETLAMTANQTYDLTQYQIYGQAAYNPATSTQPQFDAPYRADYALTPQELLVGELDVHQNYTEKFRMRRDDWAVQIQILNTSGSARIQAVGVMGVAGPSAGSRNV
jgi:hypothetical protein